MTRRIVVIVLLMLLLTSDVAFGFWGRRRRSRYYSYSRVAAAPVYSSSWGSTPQEVAQAKAHHLASVGYGYHPGGGYGGGWFEGWGMGATSEQARWGTCVPRGHNANSARGCGLAQSSNGTWFAVNIW